MINKLFVVLQIMAGLIGVLWDAGTSESYILVVHLHFLVHGPPCFPDADFAAPTWDLLNTPSCLVGSTGSFSRTKCDQGGGGVSSPERAFRGIANLQVPVLRSWGERDYSQENENDNNNNTVEPLL